MFVPDFAHRIPLLYPWFRPLFEARESPLSATPSNPAPTRDGNGEKSLLGEATFEHVQL